MKMRYRWTLNLVAALMVGGCNDSIAPDAVVGSYAATRVNGDAVPAKVESNSTLSWSLLSGTLQINADGTWRFDEVVQYKRLDGSTFFQDPPAFDAGTYTVEGDHLRFANPDPGGAPFDATFSGSRLTWSRGLMGSFAFQSLEFARK